MSDKAVHIALYPSDWLAGTRGLTPAETGVYITLVCMMYERRAPLQFDHARLARMCNCPAGTFKKILAVLIDEGKLIETPDGLWQRRVETEIAAAKGAMEEASERGRKAVNARWLKVKEQSDQAEIVTVKPQSDKQKCSSNIPKKDNDFNKGELREKYPSNTNQNQSQKVKEEAEDARANEAAASLISRLTHALGFDHHGTIPKYWISPDAPLIVTRWLTDLNLTPEEVLQVAVQNMRAHKSPANGPKTLTRHMQDFAAAKQAPRLEPTKGRAHDQPRQSPDRRAIAADDAFARRIHAAARARSPSDGDFGFG
ncbi:YdaU family protein [Paracoccus siganidrum]|uniref:YdaU family protein n=1 Tax=Paracoccus siganidrum TaxID=1276757 RepID=UPI001473BF77|nr:DUF1376 domain-containing protein [Paracoccus siganidrum]